VTFEDIVKLPTNAGLNDTEAVQYTVNDGRVTVAKTVSTTPNSIIVGTINPGTVASGDVYSLSYDAFFSDSVQPGPSKVSCGLAMGSPLLEYHEVLEGGSATYGFRVIAHTSATIGTEFPAKAKFEARAVQGLAYPNTVAEVRQLGGSVKLCINASKDSYMENVHVYNLNGLGFKSVAKSQYIWDHLTEDVNLTSKLTFAKKDIAAFAQEYDEAQIAASSSAAASSAATSGSTAVSSS